MPIQINLLAEAQAVEEMRRRDPVKRAIAVAILLVIVALAWSGIVELKVIAAKGVLAQVQTQINAKNNEYQAVVAQKVKIGAIQTKLNALQTLQGSRFLQGSLLNALQHATVTDVQLIRLREDQSYALKAGSDAKTNGTEVIPATPATVTEKIVLHLYARDFSANPGDQVNKFREAIAKQPYFQAMLDKTNGVQLAAPPSPPQNDAAKPYVLFTVDCNFREVTR